MIKLIKNLKQGQNIEIVKGCTQDHCGIDSSTCSNIGICGGVDNNSWCFTGVDSCTIDNAGCMISIPYMTT